MIVKFTDRTEMFVDANEGKKIRESLTRSAEGFLTVRGTTFKKASIMKIEEGGIDPRASLFHTDAERRQLAVGACRSEKPINLEVIRLAKDNPKLLLDKAWREEQKAKLRDTGNWCDRETGECACE
jgi:hypothetical protein